MCGLLMKETVSAAHMVKRRCAVAWIIAHMICLVTCWQIFMPLFRVAQLRLKSIIGSTNGSISIQHSWTQPSIIKKGKNLFWQNLVICTFLKIVKTMLHYAIYTYTIMVVLILIGKRDKCGLITFISMSMLKVMTSLFSIRKLKETNKLT